MQSGPRSMSMPPAGDGTPSRWSCALKSSEASFAISQPLDPAHEAARVEDAVWIEGLLEREHDRIAGWRRSPDVKGRLEGRGSGSNDHLSVAARSRAPTREGFDRGRPRPPNVDPHL